jgi:hypothetical protein
MQAKTTNQDKLKNPQWRHEELNSNIKESILLATVT